MYSGSLASSLSQVKLWGDKNAISELFKRSPSRRLGWSCDCIHQMIESHKRRLGSSAEKHEIFELSKLYPIYHREAIIDVMRFREIISKNSGMVFGYHLLKTKSRRQELFRSLILLMCSDTHCEHINWVDSDLTIIILHSSQIDGRTQLIELHVVPPGSAVLWIVSLHCK